ncbi:hypothetical protein C5167_030079 [Papaver somniferum]|nr:hypothetical protein C5167_030079 [Papaver somniferum]
MQKSKQNLAKSIGEIKDRCSAINWIQAQSASYHPSLRLKLYYSKMALSLVMTLKLQLQRNYGVLKAQKERGIESHMDDEYVNANQRDPTILITIFVASPPVILVNFCSRVKRQAIS